MNRNRPVIGVTGPARGGTAAWIFTRLAVWLQGGRAVRITTRQDPGIERLEGLILGGGADLDPANYGEGLPEMGEPESGKGSKSLMRTYLTRLLSVLIYPLIFLARKLFSVKTVTPDRERDRLERRYLQQAIDRDMPILGICRGAQLINVKLGGSLHQDIAGFYTEVPRVHSILPRKMIKLDGDSRLARVMGHKRMRVNALHHQAIDRLAESLQVVAREQNGIIQAVEARSEEYPFLVGVQWHPEYMPQVLEQRRLFRELVTQASGT